MIPLKQLEYFKLFVFISFGYYLTLFLSSCSQLRWLFIAQGEFDYWQQTNEI